MPLGVPAQYLTPQDQNTGAAYAEFIGSKIDTQKNAERSVAYHVSLPTADYGATCKLQGSMYPDGEEIWVDLKPMDETGTQYGSADIPIASGGSKYLIAAVTAPGSGAIAAFRQFRIQVKSTNSGEVTRARVRGFAK